MDDCGRHRASVLVWLRTHGYRTPGSLRSAAPDVKGLMRSAGIREEDLMEATIVKSQGKSLRLEWLPRGKGPPTRKHAPSIYDLVADELKARPGEWCCLGEEGRGAITSLRKRGLLVRERENGHGGQQNGHAGRVTVYACWPASKGKISSPQR